jgi:D-serine deaminase-like pyridoxal phosphate-dependent protein
MNQSDARKPQIGTPAEALDTPALLLDVDAFERNVAKMAAFFADKPASLRPHSKTHKCPQIALRQVVAGAIGITCAKVSEAEVMARAGVDDILIANQIVGATKIDRLTDLAGQCTLMVAVDDAENVAQLSAASVAKGVRLHVLVEVDIGMGRCGVEAGPAALHLARQVAAAPGLQLEGLMGYEGHLVLIADPTERAAKVRAAFGPLAETAAMLEEDGLPVRIVSGGGTGTYDTTGTLPFVTEVQCGSYVFMDDTYDDVRPEFEPSLSLLSTVVSRQKPRRIIVDAGLKAMTIELGWPLPLDGEGVSVRHLSEEHGILDLDESGQFDGGPGAKIRFRPSHCCTTVNLYDRIHVIQDGKLVDIWPIAARGCAQ